MALPLIPLALVAGGSAILGLIGSTAAGQHMENLSQEKQQSEILNSTLSEPAKQSALSALYGQGGGDIIVGLSPQGGDDTDQSTVIHGDGNTTTAEPVVSKETSGSNLASVIGSVAVPLALGAVGVVLLLKGGKK